ncbi:FAD-dependent thymidylate synthase [Salibacterium aidingense]|uniref:FAD-dependent thymidylate synthase n=1 Tax=Salibacterium aidingense TaxID=384933 RepID=UPI003BC209AC
MAQTEMNVTLMAHTQTTWQLDSEWDKYKYSDGQAVALSAIRTCYSPNKPSEIVAKEGGKYFGKSATDGEDGTDADRLMRMIVRSGHTSTLEHLSFTFAIEGVSRALLSQLTRHRVGFSFSVQSQRYVKFGSENKSGGMDYVMPDSVKGHPDAEDTFRQFMKEAQDYYDCLREDGISSEDARAVLPNATATNLVLTGNLRALLDFYGKRRKGRGGQHEITELAEALRREVTAAEPWTDAFFEEA